MGEGSPGKKPEECVKIYYFSFWGSSESSLGVVNEETVS